MESEVWLKVKMEPSDDDSLCGGDSCATKTEVCSSSDCDNTESDVKPVVKVELSDSHSDTTCEGVCIVNEDRESKVGRCSGRRVGKGEVELKGVASPAEKSAPTTDRNLVSDNSMDVEPVLTWPKVKVEIDVADSGFPGDRSLSPHEIPGDGTSSEDVKPHNSVLKAFCRFRATPVQQEHHEASAVEEQTVQIKKEPDSPGFEDDGTISKAEIAMQQIRTLLDKSVTREKSGMISENHHRSVSHLPSGQLAAKCQPRPPTTVSQSKAKAGAEGTQATATVTQAGCCSAGAEDDELESLPIHFMSKSGGKSSGTQTAEPACVSDEYSTKLYGCNVCFVAFSHAPQLQQHMSKHSVSKCERSVRCGQCGKVYERCSRLKEHTVIHIGVKNFQCDQCPSRFARKTTLTRHKRQVHSGQKQYKYFNGKGLYECELCHKTYVCPQGLKTHMIRHSDERPFPCDECPASFKLASCLKRHKALHSGVRPFKCELCPATFSQSFNLNQHVKSIHSTERPYKCDQCPARFKIASDVKRHQRVHALDKPYKCDLCPAEFSSSTSLNRHKNVHTSNRPFKCDQCSAQFQHATDLKSHLEIHSNSDGPLKCDLCSARFKNASYLKSHKRIHNHIKIKGRRSKDYVKPEKSVRSKPRLPRAGPGRHSSQSEISQVLDNVTS